MKHHLQEQITNSFLTRRDSLFALMVAPGAVGTGLISRPALADCHDTDRHDTFEPLRITLDDWAMQYSLPLDTSEFISAYNDPSDERILTLIDTYGNEIFIEEEKDNLVGLITYLYDSGRDTLQELDAGIREIVGDVQERVTNGIVRVKDAVDFIVLGALDAAQQHYRELDLQVILRWVARHVILAVQGAVTIGSLLQIIGKPPIPKGYDRKLVTAGKGRHIKAV